MEGRAQTRKSLGFSSSPAGGKTQRFLTVEQSGHVACSNHMSKGNLTRFARRATYVVLVALSGAATPTTAQVDWLSYQDQKFRYEIDYPQALFSDPEPMLDQGGIALQSSDGSAKMFIFGGVNASGETSAQFASGVAQLSDIHRVTYRRVTRQWFVLSGFLAGTGDIFYERVEISPDGRRLAGFRLEYPPSQRENFDHLIARMGQSLRIL